MITVYTLAYNEEAMIQFMIDHYRARFPGCRIVIDVDKMSSDETVKIAKANGCEIRWHYVHGVQDKPLTKIKNNCWKTAKTDWVLVCDLDELLDINEAELRAEQKSGTTIIRSKAYDMVDIGDTLNLAGLKYGARASGHDKAYLFNKKHIREINYSAGAHECHPVGTIKYSKQAYKLYHYCYINYGLTVKKYLELQARMRPQDKKSGLYIETPEDIRDLYSSVWNQAVVVR